MIAAALALALLGGLPDIRWDQAEILLLDQGFTRKIQDNILVELKGVNGHGSRFSTPKFVSGADPNNEGNVVGRGVTSNGCNIFRSHFRVVASWDRRIAGKDCDPSMVFVGFPIVQGLVDGACDIGPNRESPHSPFSSKHRNLSNPDGRRVSFIGMRNDRVEIRAILIDLKRQSGFYSRVYPRAVGIVSGVRRPPVFAEGHDKERSSNRAEETAENSNPKADIAELQSSTGKPVGLAYRLHSAPLGAKIGIIVALRLIAMGIICLGGWLLFSRSWLRSVSGWLILFGGILLFSGFVELAVGI